jgi:Leucine-rich repeat (LRR) protein
MLDLRRNSEEVGQFTWLESLNLQGNKLKELPKWIGNLRNIEELLLSENPLIRIPENLNDLPKLNYL